MLYDKELQHRMEEQAKIEAGKRKIEWGSQISLTKAADTDVESFVNHLDVIIFDVDGTTPGTKVYSGSSTFRPPLCSSPARRRVQPHAATGTFPWR